MAACDWLTLKTEYITTDISYRKLANKYHVPYSEISRIGKAEDWVGLRDQYRAELESKTIEKIMKAEAARASKIYSVADKLLMKIEKMVDQDEPLSDRSIRALTAAVRDLKEIQGVRSRMEQQEQEARIDALRRQNNKETTGKEPITIEIGEGLDIYCK